MTWGYTFGYRRRVKPVEASGGGLELKVPPDIVALMGVDSCDTELLLTLGNDGSVTIRALR